MQSKCVHITNQDGTLVGLLVNHDLGGCAAAACCLHGWLVGLLVTNQEGTLLGLLVTNHDLGGYGCTAAAACRLHGWLVGLLVTIQEGTLVGLLVTNHDLGGCAAGWWAC